MVQTQKLLLLTFAIAVCFEFQCTEALFSKKILKNIFKLDESAPDGSEEDEFFKLPKLKPLKLFGKLEDKKDSFATKLEKKLEAFEEKLKNLIEFKETKKEEKDKGKPIYSPILPTYKLKPHKPSTYKPPTAYAPPAYGKVEYEYDPPAYAPPALPPSCYNQPADCEPPSYVPSSYVPPSYGSPTDCDAPSYAPKSPSSTVYVQKSPSYQSILPAYPADKCVECDSYHSGQKVFT